MKPDTMVAELQAFNKRSEKKLWINTIVNYNEFLIEYANYDQGYLTQDPMVAQKISLIPIEHNPEIFALFISILNNFLNVAHIARPNLFAYCKIDAVEHNDYELMSTEEQ
jgi:hypothetical protein